MIYKIGDFYIEWLDSNFQIKNDPFMKLFEVDNSQDNELSDVIRYQTEYIDLSYAKKFPMLNYCSSSELYETDRGKFMIYHWATCRFGIGFFLKDLDKDVIRCYISPEMLNQIPIDASWFFSIAGLHRIFLNKDALILHGSYIKWNDKSIIFTAPSQTGKSTQSRLWRDTEGALIVNDDRVLIRENEEQWMSFGYPLCGSSKVCLNQTSQIGIIVVLEQGPENSIVEMSYLEKVKALVSGTEVFRWELSEVDRAIKIAERIASEVDVIKLICRPDVDAVYALKKYILERGW